MKIKIVVYIVIAMTICLSCKNIDKPKNAQKWQNEMEINFLEVLRIGSDNYENENYSFSAINDLKIDSNNNVYALDRKEMRIKKYDRNGKYLKTILLKKGQGPGEYSRPLFFDIGPKNELYIIDSQTSRLIITDEEGQFKKAIKMDISPVRIVAGQNGYYYILCDGRNAGDYEIIKYSFEKNEEISKIYRLDNDEKKLRKVGGSGELCKGMDGDIIYAPFKPYNIKRYSYDDLLKNTYSRIMDKPVEIINNDYGLPDINILTLDVAVFNDGKILYVYLDRKAKPALRQIDIFDKNGDWLINRSSKDVLPGWDGRLAKLDNENNLYLEYWTPYPHIRKYSINISKKSKS
jgi:hypothetical protein